MILYEGPSQLDGAPIVVILTKSRNRKTGGMLQTFIMRTDIEPHLALKTGADSSVCGDCKHRPFNGGACYVRVFQAPLSVWRAYKRGSYKTAPSLDAIAERAAGKTVRLGAYGDPAAVPVDIWRALVSRAAAWTGYTHQWRDAVAAPLQSLAMASTDSPDELADARAAGWRSFRVRAPFEPLAGKEIVCPASDEAGKKTTCESCRACGGTGAKARADIAIVAHGATARRFILTRSKAA